MSDEQTAGRLELPDEDWKQRLSPEQYRILRRAGTEPAFTGKYWNHKEDGSYTCAGCGEELFRSDTKFESGCGWPSFWEAADPEKVELREDRSYGMTRVEVLCRRCGGHLGHIFNDAPSTPSGNRFCINSACLNFQPEPESAGKG
jgi:peptide-methionine (R)-S-oxide reductase